MEIGIIGKPNSGKSSFFKAATMKDVEIASHPFTTIKPNQAVAYVKVDCIDRKFNKQCKPNHGKCENGKRYMPVKLWDIAGIVPDAHLGRGLGLQFLDDIRQASALIQVVDASGLTDSEGNPTENYDPSTEIEFVENEIDEWLTDIIQRGVVKYGKKLIHEGVELVDLLVNQLSGLQITKDEVEEVIKKTGFEDVKHFATELRKLAKPIIVAANKIDLDGSEENYRRMEERFSYLTFIPTSAVSEIVLEIAKQKGLLKYDGKSLVIDENKLNEKQKAALIFIEEKVLKKFGSTGIQDCLNKAVFDVLDYIVVYPVADSSKLTDKKGNVLPDAFLVKKGTTLREFAFMIHSDIGEKFIGGLHAETKMKLGSSYELKNNDVVEILFQR